MILAGSHTPPIASGKSLSTGNELKALDPSPVKEVRTFPTTRGYQQYVLEHQPGAGVTVSATRQVVVVSVTLQAPTLMWHLPGQSTVAIQATGRSQPFSGVESGQAP